MEDSGTSRPRHYYVLYDNKLTASELQTYPSSLLWIREDLPVVYRLPSNFTTMQTAKKEQRFI
jgi:hypothetical protein